VSYSLDANILLYASNSGEAQHAVAMRFLEARAADPDLLCLTWPTIMAYQRIATHPSVFKKPLSPAAAWQNLCALLALPRVRIITEEADFPQFYADATRSLNIRGNLVPDAHLAVLLRQHGVNRLYTADSDFRKFEFLEVINPFD
jgi:toxin-antitoxin system PIN domain toxin